MPGGVADLVKGVLPVGLKRNVEINGGTCGWGGPVPGWTSKSASFACCPNVVRGALHGRQEGTAAMAMTKSTEMG